MKRKQWFTLATIIVLIVAFFAFNLDQYFTLEFIQRHHQALNTTIQDHFLLASLIFFALYVVITALSLPGAAIMTILSGALFGLGYGLVIASFASSIGATLAFVIGRFLFRDLIEQRWGSSLIRFNEGIKKDGAFYLFTLRLIPVVPFFVINIVMALTALRLRTFYWVSQLGMFAGTLVYVNAGTELAGIHSLGDLVSAPLITSFVLLGLFPYIARFFINHFQNYRRYRAYNKPTHFDRNLVVIGAGAGGLVSSYIAAAVKAKVTLVEKSHMGGDCLNFGCVPSKALIRSAKLAAEIHKAPQYGLAPCEVKADFNQVMQRIKQVIAKVEPHDSVERYQKLGVDCVQGEATIVSPWEVRIGDQHLTTRNIIVATGAKPLIPPIPGLNQIPYLTSDTIWDLETSPQHLVVLGGGPIGCELAQSFARLGIKVTLVELADQLLPREERDVATLVQKNLEHDGVNVLTGHKAVNCSGTSPTYSIEVQQGDTNLQIEFDQLLLALGRKPNTKGFGLEELGIGTTPQGTIAVNDYLQTEFPNIFAVGDVAGPMQFTHFAAHQAWYASVNALFGSLKKFRTDYRVVPHVTYTYPEVGRVGLNESQAKAQNISYEVTQYDLDDLDRAICDGVDQGFIRVLTVPGKDKILGVTLVGPNAGELLAEFTLAMRHNLGLNKILGTIHAYPTWMEANKYAASQWKLAHQPKWLLKQVERYQRWLRKEDQAPHAQATPQKVN